MNYITSLESRLSSFDDVLERRHWLQHAIEHSAHLLPTQAPIRVFVHHNTLHAFEDLTFDEAVQQGTVTFGCHAYLPEDQFRQKVAEGRILPQDLAAELAEELGDDVDHLIGYLGTRFHLRLAMLQHPLRMGPDAELRWLLSETDALRKFRSETSADVREQMIADTRRWVMRDLLHNEAANDPSMRGAVKALFRRFDSSKIEQWTPAVWEAFTLSLLWHTCRAGVHGVRRFAPPAAPAIRARSLLLDVTGKDTDRMLNEVLIRFCASFLDQGMASWRLPDCERGFLRAWTHLYRDSHPVDGWMRGLPAELRRIERLGLEPLDVIDECLTDLGVAHSEREEYLTQTLLALPGWAGMIWQLETNTEWAVHPAPAGSLVEYVAVRLILERLALAHTAQDLLGDSGPLNELHSRLQDKLANSPRVSVDQRAFVVFQLAQILGWKPATLHAQSKGEWANLVEEIEMFAGPQRRRIYHLAFERRYRTRALDAFIAHTPRNTPVVDRPYFQLITCLDEREESFRRHLEEAAPRCETFGVAGFFGVAMYYRGAADAQYVPLCPIVVKPKHYVQEEVVYSFEGSNRRRAETRRALGRTGHWLHTSSRSVIRGAVTAIFGALASIPLVARVLFPRLTAKIRGACASIVQPPPMTRQLLERGEPTPGPDLGHLGYSVEEMVDIVQRVLTDIGLTAKFARILFILGHGSSSLNNPHASAYDCGACGGGRGGPNARALAAMMNDPRVRERLFQRGLLIPRETVVVGGFHNTCDDSVDYFDLDRLPSSHRDDFETAIVSINEARRRNAHERCRRFVSAELSLSTDAALRHVQARAADLSQARPECGHATNAICFVGRRLRTRGLFLDRRTFLTSYDPTKDNAESNVLERILQAVIPVCAGINLEYYFCFVDPTGYGCGSKLPHNITSLLGVMDGAASDLRPGLPWQMVEIHEPVRILFVLETTPEAITKILQRNPPLRRLVENAWVQLATLDANGTDVHLYYHGDFQVYSAETTNLPAVKSSMDWYRGWR
ncbi:MAG TPA: DUF2309 domain-containing protein, partial [Pirellulales bacterium]